MICCQATTVVAYYEATLFKLKDKQSQGKNQRGQELTQTKPIG